MTWYTPFIIIGTGFLLGLLKLPGYVLKMADNTGNAALLALMFIIGINVGADNTIISNAGIIGFHSLIICLSALFFSVLFVFILEKTVLPLDKLKDKLIDNKINAGIDVDSKGKRSALIYLIPAILIWGVVAGFFLISPSMLGIVDLCFTISLSILFVSIGIGLSQNRNVFQYIKKLGLRILLLPTAIVIGSLTGGAVASLALGIELHISIMSAGGMCYYSLTGAFMTQAYGIQAGAYGFLSNVFREFLTVLLLPLLIKVGKGAPIAAGASASMDITLAPISKFVGVELGFVSLISGIILSFIIPVLLPVLAAIFA